MTRKECEDRLIALVELADAIFKDYAPDGERLSMTICDGQANITGYRQNPDMDSKSHAEKYHVYATKFADGDVWHMDDWGRVTEEVGA